MYKYKNNNDLFMAQCSHERVVNSIMVLSNSNSKVVWKMYLLVVIMQGTKNNLWDIK